MIDLDEIERLARGIHPRWHLDGDGLRTMIRDNATGVILAVRHRAPREQHEAVMAYMIAVEPATILALVARLRAAEAVAEAAATLVDEFGGSLEMLHRNGPDYTFKNGERVLVASVLEDREEIIEATRSALAAYRALTEEPTP